MMKTAVLFLLMTISLISCAKKDGDSANPTGTTSVEDGSQTLAQLAGSGGYCEQDSSVVSGMAALRTLTINANGTYVYDVRLSNNFGACAAPQATGGNEIGVYTQSGNIAVVGPAEIASTGTRVTFTPTSATLLLRSHTYNQNVTNAIGNSLRVSPPANCAHGISFSNAQADTTFIVFGISCSGAVTIGGVTANPLTWPDGGTAYQNAVYNSDGVLKIGIAGSQDLLRPGGLTYPTSFAKTYLGW